MRKQTLKRVNVKNVSFLKLGEIFLPLLFSLFFINCYSQNNEGLCKTIQEINLTAELPDNSLLFTKEDIEQVKTISLLRSQLYKWSAITYYTLLNYGIDSAEHAIVNFYYYGGKDRQIMYHKPELFTPHLDVLERCKNKAYEIQKDSLDFNLRDLFMFMGAEDQRVRYNKSTLKPGEWEAVNNKNLAYLDSILETRGYPKRREIGFMPRVTGLDLVILHDNLSRFIGLYPTIMDLVIRNEEYDWHLSGPMERSFFLFMEDGLNKIRFLDLSKPVSDCENQFILHSIANGATGDNPKEITLDFTDLVPKEGRSQLMEEIQYYLIKFGMKAEQIKFGIEQDFSSMASGEDALSKYYLVSKRANYYEYD